jgi:hypothetical protein
VCGPVGPRFCAVHLDVEDLRGGSADLGQVQLLGAVDLLLLIAFDAGADGLGLAFDGLGGDLQSGQQLELLAALLKAGLAAHHGHHPPHSGRKLGAFHVQLPVARALAPVATRAQIVVPLELHRPQSGQQLPRPPVMMAALVSASAARRARLGRGR